MSTRAQVKVVDGYGAELWFYRHSDGYPKGTLPTLEKFLSWVKEGKIRDNVEQAAGWLILVGAEEYKKAYDKDGKESDKASLTEPIGGMSGWKCGSYEPCSCRDLHGDVEWLYTVNLATKTIEQEKV